MAIKNRMEGIVLFDVVNSNLNGNPDADNQPRIIPETSHGIVTPQATKRRIRDNISLMYEGKPGMNIFVENGANLNRKIAEAKTATGMKDIQSKKTDDIYAGQKKACELFFDVRAFGAVMSTGPNAGQVCGPVQFDIGQSIDPISIQDIAITRSAYTGDEKLGSVEAYIEAEKKKDDSTKRTMGHMSFASYGLYLQHFCISANLAAKTGYSEEDNVALLNAMGYMFEGNWTTSKAGIHIPAPIILFKHVGTDPDEECRANQCLLGCAPAHKLFELVEITRKPEVDIARTYRDYNAVIHMSKCPAGVEIGFKYPMVDEIFWGHLPADEDWLTLD